MNKPAFDGARFTESGPKIQFSTIDAQQNARLDELRKIDEKHDKQFTWSLVWGLITMLWLLMLTAILVVKEMR